MNIIRNQITPAAYLILQHNDKFLLYLRQNSGYEDGNYGLVSGHVEHNESVTHAIIREAYEEANIIIEKQNLQFAHICSRRSNKDVIDVFFKCSIWQGEIVNQEPEKCAELKFFPLAKFPNNVIPYIRDIINLTERGIQYSEIGW